MTHLPDNNPVSASTSPALTITMAAYSPVDALSALCTSLPEWNKRLNELNGQIALRQLELARLEEERHEPPAPRSLRNKGSTESLRPKDGNENSFPSEEVDEFTSNAPAESLKPIQNGVTPQRPSSAVAQQAAVTTRPPSIPIAPPGAGLRRQSSQPTPPTHPRIAPAVLRKRKTESLVSGESIAPKYRTRSMIIVYYDSAVQTAFEELVKFVSVNRNAMRKGKMAAKMAEMRRVAELEAQADEDAEEEQDGDSLTGSAALLAVQKKVAVGNSSDTLTPSSDDTAELSIPRLRYVSTRNMGPPRDFNRADNFGSNLSTGLLRGYRRSGGDGSAPDIFDELDKGLEWCQSQCEHAAHQFLRDGECSQEIESIKRKLLEVKGTSEKEVERLKKEVAEAPLKQGRKAVSAGKTRELKPVQMRKDLGTIKNPEVDNMEIDDDEGIDDMEPPTLFFKRSRDVGV